MIVSMTGFGDATAERDGTVELDGDVHDERIVDAAFDELGRSERPRPRHGAGGWLAHDATARRSRIRLERPVRRLLAHTIQIDPLTPERCERKEHEEQVPHRTRLPATTMRNGCVSSTQLAARCRTTPTGSSRTRSQNRSTLARSVPSISKTGS